MIEEDRDGDFFFKWSLKPDCLDLSLSYRLSYRHIKYATLGTYLTSSENFNKILLIG